MDPCRGSQRFPERGEFFLFGRSLLNHIRKITHLEDFAAVDFHLQFNLYIINSFELEYIVMKGVSFISRFCSLEDRFRDSRPLEHIGKSLAIHTITCRIQIAH